MLSRSQKECVRSISLYRHTCLEKNGVAINFDGKEFIIPSFIEIKKIVCNHLFNLGFTKIQRVEPSQSNCIIRIFQCLHCPAGNSFTYNLYGANCYVLKYSKWVTTDEEIPIDFSECILRHWISEDKYINFDCEFFDCYVQIS